MIAATPAPRDRAALAWWSFLALAGAMAGLALLQWVDALVTGRPVLYGEGPVANAALLLRQGDAYRDVAPERFVAANYPPLYLWLAGAGDPFRVGRGLTMICAIAVAAMVAWRARGAGRLAAAALGAGWLAIAPVAIWGAAVKPDLLAVALTAGAVAVLDARTSRLAVGDWSWRDDSLLGVVAMVLVALAVAILFDAVRAVAPALRRGAPATDRA